MRIHVQGYPDKYPDRRAAGSDLVHEYPAVEPEAWARAVLGRQWSDYAYQMIRRTDVDRRMRTNLIYTQPLFVVFVASDGTPVLAPACQAELRPAVHSNSACRARYGSTQR